MSEVTTPVKPISEIEEKAEVSVNDKILILDSVSEEARLASKEELKWDKWDQWEKWDTWATWPQWPKWDKGDKWDTWPKGDTWAKWDTWATWAKWDKGDKWDKWDTGSQWPQGEQWIQWIQWVQWEKWDKGDTGTAATITVWSTTTWGAWTSASVTNSWTSSAAVLDFTIPKWDKGDKWDTGNTWATGNGIASITSSKSWKITTVTITETDGDSNSFEISDWQDGEWAWDVLWPNSSTDGNVVLFDWATWKIIKDSTKQFTPAWIWALASSTKYWASLSLSVNTTTYVVTAQLKDQDWNNLWSAATIDLPLESVVVSGSYDSDTKKVILTLQNWNTIEFSIADLVSWLQSEITSSNKLDADLVDDSTSTNKFVTASDKTTWGNKQDKLVAWSNIQIAADGKTISATDTTYSTASSSTNWLVKLWSDTVQSVAANAVSGTAWKTYALQLNSSWQLVVNVPREDHTYTASSFDIKDLADSTWLRTTWSGKQDALSTQTAYTSKWTSTKVPTITTNTLWQVTAISETSIDFPVTSVNWQTWAVTVSGWHDYSWNTLTWTSLTITGTNYRNQISTSSNISVSAGTGLTPGMEYILRVVNSDSSNAITMTWDSVAYTIPAGWEINFKFISLTATTLDFDWPRIVATTPSTFDSGKIYFEI